MSRAADRGEVKWTLCKVQEPLPALDALPLTAHLSLPLGYVSGLCEKFPQVLLMTQLPSA